MPPFMSAMRPQGLYDPWYEHDSCGVGFVVNIKGERSHTLMRQALEVLANVEHRGAVGCDPDYRRRRRHPDADSRTISSGRKHRGGISAAGAGAICRGDALPAAGARRTAPLRAADRADHRRARLDLSRLAHCADEQQPARRRRPLSRTGDPADFRPAAEGGDRRSRLRTPPLRLPPASGEPGQGDGRRCWRRPFTSAVSPPAPWSTRGC